jgi:hypothetical protein
LDNYLLDQAMENATVEMQPTSQAASKNPTANRPEDAVEAQQKVQMQHQSRDVRAVVRGDVSIRLVGGFPQIGKLQDASMIGLSALVDIQLPRSKIYELQVKAFRNGRVFEFIVQAVCIHSTLSGRGFKMGFKFGPMNKATTEIIAAMIA